MYMYKMKIDIDAWTCEPSRTWRKLASRLKIVLVASGDTCSMHSVAVSSVFFLMNCLSKAVFSGSKVTL